MGSGVGLSGEGFSVDLDALLKAASGILDAMEARQVKDLDCEQSAFGHEGLADITKDFCDRWQRGVKNLLDDGKEVAGRLADSAKLYLQMEQDTLAHLQSVAQQPEGR